MKHLYRAVVAYNSGFGVASGDGPERVDEGSDSW